MAPTMPSKNHSSAPKFDGKAGSLPMFLDDVEQLAENCELTPKQKIEWAIRYAPGSDEHELWSSLDSAQGTDWDAFKKELFIQYPGAGGDRKYSVANLEALTEKQAAAQITTADQFGTYYRAFSKISRFLKAKNKLNDREISNLFMRGLDYAFRVQVRAQLRAENPKHHSDDPYTLDQICEAALFILSCNHDDAEVTAPAVEGATTVKREQFDLTNLAATNMAGINLGALAMELMKHMNLQQPAATVFNQTAQNPSYGSTGATPRPRSNDCSFCSDPTHYQHSCPKVAEYIQKGLCARNTDNFIVLPNGERVTPRLAPGKNMKERIDNWHKGNPTNLATVSSNFVSSGSAWSLPSTAAFTEASATNDNEVKLATQREIEEVEMLESLIASTQKKVDEARKKMPGKPYAGPTTRNMAKSASHESAKEEVPNASQTPAQKTASTPQYRYTTAVEDPKIAEQLLKRTLESPLTLTGRELLAIAPDVRKQLRELVAPKKVTTSHIGSIDVEEGETVLGVESYMAALLPQPKDLVVAKHSEELRALDFKIGDLTVEGVMDEGSQICVLRKDIWEKLGLPLRSDHIMVMESANSSKNCTLGLLQNLEVCVGGYSFYIQVQVVKDAPYELLIGLPFMSLTNLVTKHYEDGSSDVVLIDPNTGAVITVPTRRRKREETCCNGANAVEVGF